MMKKQRGVTMIELLISMVLGLSLVAGIGQLFVQSQKSFRLQRNLSDMTDDASFILESLAKGILLAGYADEPNCSLFPAVSNVLPVSGISTIDFGYCETIHGTNTQLVYRYQLGNSGYAVNNSSELNNFIGTAALTGIKNNPFSSPKIKGDIVTVRIYKKNDSDGTPVLYSKAETESDTGNNAEPLISDVEKLEFRYGIKTGDGHFYYTKTEDDINNIDDWKKVFAVKIFLVMRSADDNLVRVQSGYKIDGVDASPAPTDRRLYKTFSKTIFLRAPIQ